MALLEKRVLYRARLESRLRFHLTVQRNGMEKHILGITAYRADQDHRILVGYRDEAFPCVHTKVRVDSEVAHAGFSWSSIINCFNSSIASFMVSGGTAKRMRVSCTCPD